LALATFVTAASATVTACAGLRSSAEPVTNSRSTTPTTTTDPANAGDPAPERGGTIPAQAQAAETQLAPAAGASTPEAAIARYASLYINWTAANVVSRQHELASISLGQARARAQQAEASVRSDTLLTRSQVANSGQVIAISQGRGSAAGQWVVVTNELTSGQGAYSGLPPTAHVTYAQVTHTSQGWIVSTWKPQN
jgi:hypothetical protein